MLKQILRYSVRMQSITERLGRRRILLSGIMKALHIDSMVKVSKYGKMERNMRVNGIKESHLGKGS